MPKQTAQPSDDRALAERLLRENSPRKALAAAFLAVPIDCLDWQRLDTDRYNARVAAFDAGTQDRVELLTQIIAQLRAAAGKHRGGLSDELVAQVLAEVQAHLTETYPIEQIAETLHISFHYMCHIFRALTDTTVGAYRNALRISRGRRLLRTTQKKITEIAADCGFENASYFTEVFTRMTGVSPSRYRAGENARYLPYYDAADRALCDRLPRLQFLENDDPFDLTPCTPLTVRPVYRGNETFAFLHEAAVIHFHGTLFAAWYSCPRLELTARSPILLRRSRDGGESWDEPQIVVDDPSGKILYCPPVFGVCNDTLYLLLNEMTAPDHIHALNCYRYDERCGKFRFCWSRPLPFKLNTNVVALPNGKLLLPGRIGALDGFPNTPAVLLSDSGEIDAEWRVVPVAENGTLPDGSALVHPELSAIVCDGCVYLFCRDDRRRVPLVYRSTDNGEHWTGPYAHDLPFSSSKIYSGTLRDGRNYVIGNVLFPRRSRLALYLSAPGTMRFGAGRLLRDGFDPAIGANLWHYPAADEADGALQIIATVQDTVTPNAMRTRSAVLFSVPTVQGE